MTLELNNDEIGIIQGLIFLYEIDYPNMDPELKTKFNAINKKFDNV